MTDLNEISAQGVRILLEEMSWPEVHAYAALNPIVLIPAGAVEQHGPHLPLLVDACIATEICKAAAVRARLEIPVLVAPTLNIGCSEEHLDFAGTISLSPEIFMAVAREMVLSLARHGFKRFFFLNGHAGNIDALRLVVRSLRQHDILAAVSSYWQLASEQFRALRKSAGGGMNHGGEEETSLMLHLRPELVVMHNATANVRQRGSAYLSGDYTRDATVTYGRMRSDIAPQGHNGDPTAASAEQGAALFEAAVEATVSVLRDLVLPSSACTQVSARMTVHTDAG